MLNDGRQVIFYHHRPGHSNRYLKQKPLLQICFIFFKLQLQERLIFSSSSFLDWNADHLYVTLLLQTPQRGQVFLGYFSPTKLTSNSPLQ